MGGWVRPSLAGVLVLGAAYLVFKALRAEPQAADDAKTAAQRAP
jgi:hypothetical protein